MTPTQVTDVIAAAIQRAEQTGYTRPHDIATAIKVDLAEAGLKIVHKPRPSSQESK